MFAKISEARAKKQTVFSPVDLLVICLINQNINTKAPSKRR